MENAPEIMESYSKLSNIINTKNIKLWLDEAFINNLQEQLNKLDCKVESTEEAAIKLEKENVILEQEIAKENDSIEKLNASLELDTLTVIALGEQKRLLEIERQHWREKYAATEKEYQQKYEDYKNSLIDQSPEYKILMQKKVEEKKLCFKLMWLQRNTELNISIQKQRDEIQKKRFYAEIIEFAKANLEYAVNKKLNEIIKEREAEEKMLLQEYSRLQMVKAKREMEEQAALKANANLKPSAWLSNLENSYKSFSDSPFKEPRTYIQPKEFKCFKTKLVSAHDEVAIKKERSNGPRINILDMKTIKAKNVTFKNGASRNILSYKKSTGHIKPILKQNKQTNGEKYAQTPVNDALQIDTNKNIQNITGDIKPILKQNQQINEEKSAHTTVKDALQLQANKNIQNTNQMEWCETNCSPKFSERALYNLDTTNIFSFTSIPQTVSTENGTKNNNVEKYSSQQGSQQTAFPHEELPKAEMVDSRFNNKNGAYHLEISMVQKQASGVEETANSSSANIEMIDSWMLPGQLDYTGNLSDGEEPSLNRTLLSYEAPNINIAEDSQQCVFEKEQTMDDIKKGPEDAPFKSFNIAQTDTNTGSNSIFLRSKMMDIDCFLDL